MVYSNLCLTCSETLPLTPLFLLFLSNLLQPGLLNPATVSSALRWYSLSVSSLIGTKVETYRVCPAHECHKFSLRYFLQKFIVVLFAKLCCLRKKLHKISLFLRKLLWAFFTNKKTTSQMRNFLKIPKTRNLAEEQSMMTLPRTRHRGVVFLLFTLFLELQAIATTVEQQPIKQYLK